MKILALFLFVLNPLLIHAQKFSAGDKGNGGGATVDARILLNEVATNLSNDVANNPGLFKMPEKDFKEFITLLRNIEIRPLEKSFKEDGEERVFFYTRQPPRIIAQKRFFDRYSNIPGNGTSDYVDDIKRSIRRQILHESFHIVFKENDEQSLKRALELEATLPMKAVKKKKIVKAKLNPDSMVSAADLLENIFKSGIALRLMRVHGPLTDIIDNFRLSYGERFTLSLVFENARCVKLLKDKRYSSNTLFYNRCLFTNIKTWRTKMLNGDFVPLFLAKDILTTTCNFEYYEDYLRKSDQVKKPFDLNKYTRECTKNGLRSFPKEFRSYIDQVCEDKESEDKNCAFNTLQEIEIDRPSYTYMGSFPQTTYLEQVEIKAKAFSNRLRHVRNMRRNTKGLTKYLTIKGYASEAATIGYARCQEIMNYCNSNHALTPELLDKYLVTHSTEVVYDSFFGPQRETRTYDDWPAFLFEVKMQGRREF